MRPSPFREYRIKFERVPAGERAVDPDDGGGHGLWNKLGGTPDWLQLDETPVCTGCGQEMGFVGQLDSMEQESEENPHSVEHLSGKQHFIFGDAGLIYIFYCQECSQVKAVLQF